MKMMTFLMPCRWGPVSCRFAGVFLSLCYRLFNRLEGFFGLLILGRDGYRLVDKRSRRSRDSRNSRMSLA